MSRSRWWVARDHVVASRAIGLMTTAGSCYAIVNGIVSPETMGTRAGGWAVTVGFAAVVVVVGALLVARPRRAPDWAPAALAGLAGAMVLVLDLWTGDASFGAQIYLGWPALFAAFYLRPGGAWLLTAQAVVADVVLLAVLEGMVGVLRDVPAHLATFALVTALLTTSGQRQERLTTRLRSEASEDCLTGLRSRRAFDRAFAEHLDDGTAEGLLLVDVDRFKTVNDTHGHPTGDAVLCAVALELQAACRAGDVVARLGGDEFAVVLVGEPFQERDLRAVADRFHAAVARCNVPGATDHRLSVSVGVARAGPGETVRTLLDAADEALYEAKRGGRDRVAEARR